MERDLNRPVLEPLAEWERIIPNWNDGAEEKSMVGFAEAQVGWYKSELERLTSELERLESRLGYPKLELPAELERAGEFKWAPELKCAATSWSWSILGYPKLGLPTELERIISNWNDGADEKSTLTARLIKFLEKEVMSFGVTANGKSTLADARTKKVLLFGRTGEGKSIIANALVTGGIEQVVFPWNDGAACCTSEVKKASGRGWTVTDTVGLGGAETGAISNAEAQERLTAHLKMVRDQYSHIIFVQKANRVTVMDELNWLLFRSIFDFLFTYLFLRLAVRRYAYEWICAHLFNILLAMSDHSGARSGGVTNGEQLAPTTVLVGGSDRGARSGGVTNGEQLAPTTVLVGGSDRDANGLLIGDSVGSRCRERLVRALGFPHLYTMEGGTSVYTTSLVLDKLGKRIFVVCVLASSGPNDSVHKEPDFRSKKFTRLHLLSYMFKEHKLSMMILVKIIGTDHSEAIKSGIRDVLQRAGFARSNISFETFEEDKLPATVRSILGHSRDPGTPRNSLNTMGPFSLREVKSTAEEKDANGAWGPLQVILLRREGNGKSSCAQMLTSGNGKSTLADARTKKVLLFGRTGEGKSIIANALVTGGIEQVVFPWNDGAAGCTSEVKKASGRGWTVTDTVGLGGAETGAISNAEAQERLTAHLKMVRDQYSHIIFVQKANRVTVMDELNWLLFRSIFEGAEEAFVFLFTSADENWLKDNKDGFPSYMEGVQTLTVDIPPISKRRVAEKRRKAIREKSILKLEEGLDKINEQRGNKYSTPKISRMTDEELEEKSASLREFVVNTIRSMFVPQMWLTVALKLSSLVPVLDLIPQITDTA
ncbi:unnamed protein product [Calypogeia fissa]